METTGDRQHDLAPAAPCEPPVTDGVARRRGRFLRRRHWLCAICALVFVVACVGMGAVAVVHGQTKAGVAVYFVNVLPPFVWFGAFAPGALLGFAGVRKHWFVLGIGVCLVAVAATEDVRPWLRLFPGRARGRFLQTRAASVLAEAKRTVALRVITWNVASGREGTTEAAEQLSEMDADIVFLQESGATRVWNAVRESDYFRGYHLLKSHSKGLLSRFPAVRIPNGPLPSWRGAVWEVEVAPGRKIICINVHLRRQLLTTRWLRSPDMPALREAIEYSRGRLENLQQTLDYFRRRAPVILAGDFNLPAGYADVRPLREGFQDCFAARGSGWGATVPSRFPVYRIDLIFVPRDATVYHAQAVPTRFSDHRMTLAEVVLDVPVAEVADPTTEEAAGGATSSPEEDV